MLTSHSSRPVHVRNNELRAAGEQPVMMILEQFSDVDTAAAGEEQWIVRLKGLGVNLLNIRECGKQGIKQTGVAA